FEEVRRERMSEAVRVPEQPAHRARVEAPPASGQEQGVVRAGGQCGPSRPEIARELECRLLAERHDALLPALASDVNHLAVEVDVAEIERDRLLAAETRGVQELEQRAVAERERRVAVDELEQLVYL